MKRPSIPENEALRLHALSSYEVLDTANERSFDLIVESTARALGAPIALVSLVDSERQWFKARFGLELVEAPRAISFCGHVVAQGRSMVVEDALCDPRFCDNPLVSEAPHVRFYAGAPLRTPEGHVIGTLCAIDITPRTITPEQREMLESMALLVMSQLEERKRLAALRASAERNQRLLCDISIAQDEFIAGAPLDRVFSGVLQRMLHFTQSALAFIADGPFEGDEPPHILGIEQDDLLASDQVPPKALSAFVRHKCGAALLNGQVVYATSPSTSPALASGVLDELRAFIGLPLWRAGKLSGVIGLLKRGGHYDRGLPQELGSLLATCAGLLEARRIDLERQRSETERQAGEVRLQAVFDAAADMIITIDETGTIRRVNRAVQAVLGYSPEELLGEKLTRVMPHRYREAHQSQLQKYLQTGIARVIGRSRTLEALRKDGSIIAVELSVSESRSFGARVFTGIMRDVSERKRMEDMKSEFVSAVSHELRTPLTSIRGALGLLAANAVASKAEHDDLLSVALRNAERLTRLINDILDLEKMDSGSMKFHLTRVDLHSAAEDAVQANMAYASELGVALRVVSPPLEAPVCVDEDRLALVLANLLSNAAKFSPRGERVDVAVTRRGAAFCVAIKDRGPGIPESFRTHVFERFAQNDGSDARVREGTGLGLSIVKKLVLGMGGAVWFESVVGRGSTFYVEFPAFEAQAEPLSQGEEHAHPLG